jgi:hypothetical protein
MPSDLVLSLPGGQQGELMELLTKAGPSLPALISPRIPNNQQSQIGWLPAGGNSNVLQLVPAGHTPGLYMYGQHVHVDVASSAGSFNCFVNFSSPGLGAFTFVGFTVTLTSTAAGRSASATVYVFESDGTAAITTQMQIAIAVVGTPQVSFWAGCQPFAL